MKKLIQLSLVTILVAFCTCSPKADNQNIEMDTAQKKVNADTTSYDSLLARELGADQYGMKKYVIAFLKKGPNRDLSKEDAAALQNKHMQNISKMAEAGKLVLAGPFFGSEELKGIYIFDVRSIEEAETLTNTDPAIKTGSLTMELKEWYGSAALMSVNKIHKKIAKIYI